LGTTYTQPADPVLIWAMASPTQLPNIPAVYQRIRYQAMSHQRTSI